MAPTPTEGDSNNLLVDPTSLPKPSEGYWTTVNIAVTAVFALLFLTIILVLLIFFFHRRSHKKKRANRKSDKDSLLAHEDKTSNMFSRGRHSSVTLYVDEETEARSKRKSSDTISLIPLQVTPLEEIQDPIEPAAAASNGSGVSALSRLSTNTMSTMMLSPISPSAEEGDLGMRQSGGRPRSTSTASQRARYYESTPMDVERPPVPVIIRTASD
jgi:cbb3-type cytochrome oxidase subunit 3